MGSWRSNILTLPSPLKYFALTSVLHSFKRNLFTNCSKKFVSPNIYICKINSISYFLTELGCNVCHFQNGQLFSFSKHHVSHIFTNVEKIVNFFQMLQKLQSWLKVFTILAKILELLLTNILQNLDSFNTMKTRHNVYSKLLQKVKNVQ
mgnify:CR=1 FL=1